MEPDFQEGITVQLLPQKLQGRGCSLYSWEIVAYKMLEFQRRYNGAGPGSRDKIFQ